MRWTVSGNIYVTGEEASQDFPRTHGAYGQNNYLGNDLFVTKIDNLGTQLLYSTNLEFGIDSFCTPAGIAVNTDGAAFITGNIYPLENFPEDNSTAAPPVPDQPTKLHFSTISPNPIINGAPEYECFERTPPAQPGPPQIGTSQDWMVVLNSTGSDLLFDSYLGGILDNRVYAPYVDGFGDAWCMGWVDSARQYELPQPGSTPLIYHRYRCRSSRAGGGEPSLRTRSGRP